MEPRPLLELNVQQAIASILLKPRWWIKWHDQDIRNKWLSEVGQQLLIKTFDQSLPDWSHGREPIHALNQLLDEQDDVDKPAKLRKWLQGIVTDFKKGKDEEEYDNDDVEDDDEEDDDDEEVNEEDVDTKKRKREDAGLEDDGREEKRLRALEEEVEAQESYPTVKWTFNQLLLHERLRVIPVEEWTGETTHSAIDAARTVNDPSIPRRAAEFVLAIRRGVSVEEALPLPTGSDLLSEDRKLKLKLHCEKIHQELAAVQSYITKYVDLVAKRENLTASTDRAKVVISPAGVDGVWISDNIVSSETAMKFNTEVAVLENVPDEEKDWHPHSNKQVLDLVHPSLFCCVFGQTLKASSALDASSFSSPAEQMHRVMFTGSEFVERPRHCNTDYQWIPTDFLVDDGGEPGNDVVNPRILSYINNLHPEQHGDLYSSIGRIFGHFLPLFERMLGDQGEGMPRSAFRANMQCHDTSNSLPPRPKIPTLKKLPSKCVAAPLRGKQLQAIVKIAEIILTPTTAKYKGGTWHIERSPAERIVGTGIYYFGCENVKNSRLSFRAEVEEPPYRQSDDDGVAEIYGLFNNSLLVQELGSVETLESRCVVFPNTLQHQVQPFELEDPTKPGVRKILAFFLIDPENPIPSTSVIPPQQQNWMQSPMNFTDVDAVKQNVRSMLPKGMTLEDAKEHRLKLMKERAALESSENDRYGNSRYFSLCEH